MQGACKEEQPCQYAYPPDYLFSVSTNSTALYAVSELKPVVGLSDMLVLFELSQQGAVELESIKLGQIREPFTSLATS